MIQINEIMTKEQKNKLQDLKIIKFRSETINFSSLGYNSLKVKFVILENNQEYRIKTEKTIRELNKFKGLCFCEVTE